MRDLIRRPAYRAGRLLRRLSRPAIAVAFVALATPSVLTQSAAPGIKITSPLGRTGLTGTIRIVARLDGAEPSTAVRFYADKTLLATDSDGPPYDTLWVDENPFEKRELSVEADVGGRVVRDTLTLNPMAVAEVAEVRSVVVEATVLDQRGNFIRNLGRDDFEVLENGVKESVDQVKDQREPALYTLLVDSSQSMARHTETIHKMAEGLLAPLAKTDRVVVAPFSRGVVSVTGPTADRQTVLDAIRAIQPSGGTAILDSLRQAAGTLRSEQARRVVVLMTDGYDENSASSPDQAAEALRQNNIALYVVGMGGIAGMSLQGETMLTKLAESTGGRAWFPRDERRLVEVYDAIASDVAQKYLISYTPTDQKRDGSWRSIILSVNRKGAQVRARQGYNAPIPPPIRASLEFTAVGAANTPVVLAPDQIVVKEDGVDQKVDTFQEAVLPVTIMLALDSSGSMKNSSEKAQEAARNFVNSLRPEDEIGMIMFANKSNYIHSPTTRRDYSMEAIDKYKAEGGTALYDGLYDSLQQVGSVKNRRRVVVVVTDGRDENDASNGPGSLRTWDEVVALQQKTEATIYCVGIGARVDRSRLLDLAARSGGAAYFPEDTATLTANYEKILDELRRRYVIGYESTNRDRDGKWRAIDVSVKGGGVLIRSRGGYFAPAE